MCSVNEIEQAGDTIKSKKGAKRREKQNTPNVLEKGSCMKCPEKAVVLVRNNDPFCRTCFLEYIVHKFRATIGKARVIYQGEKVLLAVSGGSSSSAMLDLVIKGLGKAAVKKHRFQPGVVYIDDEGVCGQSFEDRNKIKQHIQELMRQADLPYHCVSLADLFSQKEAFLEQNLHQLDISDESQVIRKETIKARQLEELFEKVATATAREDLLTHLYRNLLQKAAKDHGYDYIMVGDCGTNIAVRILADVSQGRGAQLPFNVNFKDARSEVPVLRPMREFTKKEIGFYNYFCNVTSFAIPAFTTKASSHGSIHRLTEELIFGLQAVFPSTVSTVLKTGNKISSNVNSRDGQNCVLCLAPLDVQSGFSEVYDQLKTCGDGDKCGSNGGCQNTNDGGDDTESQKNNSDDFRVDGFQKGDGGVTSDQKDGCQETYGSKDLSTDNHGHSIYYGDVTQSSASGVGCSSMPGAEQNTDYHNILLKKLCYGCMLTYCDIKDKQVLVPSFLTENLRNQIREKTMKDQIGEFLLQD